MDLGHPSPKAPGPGACDSQEANGNGGAASPPPRLPLPLLPILPLPFPSLPPFHLGAEAVDDVAVHHGVTRHSEGLHLVEEQQRTLDLS